MTDIAPDLTDPGSRNWKLTLAYDGSDFHGWQIQPDLPTIQAALSDAIFRLTGERVLPQGSGRTDAGVHALQQVASFPLRAPIPPSNLLRALNRALPESVRILGAEIASKDFHARHSATGKTYEYRIFRGEVCPPTLARYVFALNWPLNLESMAVAAAAVVGRHDFSSFAAQDPDQTSRLSADPTSDCIRTIEDSHWKVDGDILRYQVTGSGFLHHMVRNLVGTFLEVGRGARSPDSIRATLVARSRAAAGPTAPARGLFLVAVRYSPSPAMLP